MSAGQRTGTGNPIPSFRELNIMLSTSQYCPSDEVIYVQTPGVPQTSAPAGVETDDPEDSWNQGLDDGPHTPTGSGNRLPIGPLVPNGPAARTKASGSDSTSDDSDSDSSSIVSIPSDSSSSDSDDSSSANAAVSAAAAMNRPVRNHAAAAAARPANSLQQPQAQAARQPLTGLQLICMVLVAATGSGLLAWGIRELLEGANNRADPAAANKHFINGSVATFGSAVSAVIAVLAINYVRNPSESNA